jgi:hypothetical protein
LTFNRLMHMSVCRFSVDELPKSKPAMRRMIPCLAAKISPRTDKNFLRAAMKFPPPNRLAGAQIKGYQCDRPKFRACPETPSLLSGNLAPPPEQPL